MQLSYDKNFTNEEENEYTVHQSKGFILKTQKLIKTQKKFNKITETTFNKKMFEGATLHYNNKNKLFNLKCDDVTYSFDKFYSLGYDALYRFVNKTDKKTYFITQKAKILGPYENVVNATKTHKNNNIYLVYDENYNLIYVDKFGYSMQTGYKYANKSNCVLDMNDKYVYCDDKYVPNPNLVFDDAITKLYEDSANNFIILSDSKSSKLYLINKNKILKTFSLYHKTINIEKMTNNIVEVKANNTTYLFNINNGELISDITNDEYNFKVFAGTEEIYTKIINENNNVVLVEKNGRYALADLKTKKLLSKFEFDNNKDVFENSDKYMKVVKNGKTGLYNTQTKRMVISPFCKNILLDNQNACVEKEEYERFYFLDDNGKYGIVNTKNHIIVEPIISKICYKLKEEKYTFDNIQFSYKGKPFETKICLTKPLLFKGLKKQYNKEFMVLNFPFKIMKYVHFDFQDMKNHKFITTEKPMTTEKFLVLQNEKQDKLNQKFANKNVEKEI